MPKLKVNDPVWRELKSKGTVRKGASNNLADTPEGPYYVGWRGQGHEWYSSTGNDGPETGKGRYKSKIDGSILARDIKSYAQAKKIADNLDKSHTQGKFYDKTVYGKWGKDWYVSDYHGAYVGSHAQAKEEDGPDQWDLEYKERVAKASGRRNRPTSFANHVKESFSKFIETKASDKTPIAGTLHRQSAKLKGVFESKKSEFKKRMTADPHFKVSE